MGQENPGTLDGRGQKGAGCRQRLLQQQAHGRMGKAAMGLHRGRVDGRGTPLGWRVLARSELVAI